MAKPHNQAERRQLFDTQDRNGSPFAPNTDADVEIMLDAIGADSIEDLFDIPDSVRFDGTFDIDSASEQRVMQQLQGKLEQNASLTEFLGRDHYSHYVPSLVDHLSLRSEFITSYTQYQPEVSQGFLQALFEYQSLLVELTGLGVANCSMYDAATALGEVALFADRVRQTDGERVLIPDYVREERRSTLENYVAGSDLTVGTVPTKDGVTDPDALAEEMDDSVVMVYVENPTTEGVIEEHLADIGEHLMDRDALFCLGSDPVALSLLQRPADVGADAVIGDASALGLPASYGMGLGLFACREEFLRQTPGRLVGASEDADGQRAYTLTLQTREQHIRRERATSNICTNQAWVALRCAIHASVLGPSGLVSLAEDCARLPAELAAKLDSLPGVTAPARDRHHFREFTVAIESDAREFAAQLAGEGIAVHALDSDKLQVCVTETNANATDELVAAFEEVVA